MKKPILFVFLFAFLILFGNKLVAQAPIISYTTSMPIPYPVGTAITTLTPTNTGGAPSTGFYSFTTFISLTANAYGVATDAFSNVYTVDYHGGSGGILYKYNSSSIGGAINSTTMAGPDILTVDGANNVYVSDFTNSVVYKFNSSGTLLSTITGPAGGFGSPYGLATDASNNLYVADLTNNTVVKVLAGATTGTVIQTGFNGGYGLAIIGNDLYVSEYTGNDIIKITNGITGSTTKTTFATGLSGPRNIGNDAFGKIYVADYLNNRVQVIPSTGGTGTTVISGLNGPRDVSFDISGNLYIANGLANQIIRSIPGKYSVSPVLPAGLSLDVNTGYISGTPTAVTPATVYTITAGNTTGTSSTTVTISTITAAPSLSYSVASDTLGLNNLMTPLTPTNSGGAVPATVYGTVSVFAGSTTGANGTTNATGTAARFKAPSGMSVNNLGAMYVADKTNDAIRGMTQGAVVTTFAGTIGTAGRSNTGTGTFNLPRDVASDLSGNVYVADSLNNEIRKITPAGVVSLFAGNSSGTSGSTDATGSAASFKGPSGVAVDALGNIYVADFGNNKIREITPAGVVTTLAGSGTAGSTDATGAAASFNGPTSVAVDATGNVYVADKGSRKIRKVTSGGVVTTFAGSGVAGSANGTGTAATFNAPNGIAVDASGNVYVSDGGSTISNKIRMITSAGVVTTVAGTGAVGHAVGVGTVSTFNVPGGLDIDPTTGNLFVTDVGNNNINEIIGTGYSISPTTLPTGLSFNATTGTISGTPTAASGPTVYTITGFNAAGSSAATITLTVALLQPGISYTTPDSYLLNSTITSPTLTNSGGAVGALSSYVTGTALTGATLSAPYGMAIDNSGNIYVANSGNGTVSKYSSSGTYIGVFASGLTNPVAMVFDASNNCYILGEAATSKVYKYNSSGTLLNGNYIAGLNVSWGIAIDNSSNLYFTNINGATYTVREYNSAATFVATTMTFANLNSPTGITIDASGNCYILNGLGNGRIYKYAATTGGGTQFTATTFGATSYAINTDAAGNVYVCNSGAGSVSVYNSGATLIASLTSITTPRGVEIDSQGYLYVAGNTGNTVTRYAPNGGYFLASPLPTGIVLNSSTGVISGTPTVTTPATNFTVTAWNSAGGGNTIINITCYSQFTWTGATSSAWGIAGNWTTTAPTTVPTSADQARIGADAGTITNLPIIPASTTINIGSIVMGTLGSKAATIDVDGTGVLNVSGDITYQSDTKSLTNTAFATGFTSATSGGTIIANNLNIIANTTSLNSFTEKLTSSVTNLKLSGDLNLTSSINVAKIYNSTFTLSGGIITADGINTTNSAGNTSTISIGSNTTINFTGTASLSGLSTTGTNTMAFNGTGVTVGFTGSNNQVVYTDAVTGLTAGVGYTNLAFSGTGIKTATTGNINITGSFTNSMASDTLANYVDFSSPTVNFTGGAQALAGGTGVGTTFYNVTMSGVGTKTMSGLFNIASTGVLTMTGANTTILNAGSSVLTLQSDINGSATIAALSGPVINGTVNVQRFITGGTGTRGYRLLSSPVYASAVAPNNVYSINYIANSSFITGTTVTTTGPGIDKAGNPTLYLFRENITPSQASFTGGNFRGVGNMGTTGSTSYINYTMDVDGGPFNIPAGNGFLFFFRGDRSKALIGTETVTTYVPTNTTLTATGTLNQGSITVHDWFTPSSANLSFTTISSPSPGNGTIQGYNLIGNPYPSSISWTSLYANNNYNINNNVGVSIYEFNPFTNQYGAYVEGAVGGTGGFDDVIASGQSFFVVATNASASLNFTEACKTTSQPSTLLLNALPVATVPQYMHLKMIKDSINYDDVIIAFKAGADTKYSIHEDALHLTGNSPPETLTTLSSDSVNLSVNYLPLPTKPLQTIRLNVNATASGTFNLAKTELTGIPAFYEVWLKDNLLKDSVDLRANSNYSFTIDKTNLATFGVNRFQVLIRENPALALQLINFSALKVAGAAQTNVSWAVQNEANYTMFYVQRSIDHGKTFQTIDSLQSTGIGYYSFTDNNPVKGEDQYRMQLKDVNGTITYSTIVIVQFPDNSLNVSISNISIYPNPANDVINVTVLGNNASTATYSVSIINSDGGIVKKETESQSSWQNRISDLAPGIYILRVVNTTNQQVVGTNKFIKL